LRCSVGRIAAKIDVRADDGFAIFWPAHGYPILHWAEPVEWPEALLALAQRSTNKQATLPIPQQDNSSGRGVACGVRRLTFAEIREINRYLARVENAPVGTRNSALNTQAFLMAKFLLRGLRPEIAEQLLSNAARRAGLESAEIERTIRSGLNSGLQKGRHHDR
jgi:hypothetical protein